MSFNAVEHIVRATLGNFVTGGEAFEVQSVTLNLTLGGIPEAKATILPMSEQRVQRASVGRLVAARARLDAIANSPDRSCVLYIDMESQVEVQRVTLQDWLLTSVGGVIDREGKLIGITVSIKHPAWELTEGVTTLHSLGTVECTKLEQIVATNVLDMFISAERYYLKQHRTGASSRASAAPAYKASLKAYERTIKAASDTLGWLPYPRGACDPLPKHTGFSADTLKKAMFEAVVHGGNVGFWDKFSTEVLAQWNLTLAPTYTAPKLAVTPFAPWQASSFKLAETNVTRVEQPPVDRVSLRGFRYPVMAGASNNLSFWENAETLREQLFDHREWLAANKEGAVLNLNLPSWLANLMSAQASLQAAQYQATKLAKDNKASMPYNSFYADVPKTKESPGDLRAIGALIRDVYAPQTYSNLYRRDTSIVLGTRLMLTHPMCNTPDNHVIPGITVTLTEDPDQRPMEGGGGGLVEFFLTRVAHHIDCKGRASTELGGQYVRSPGAVTVTGEGSVAVITKSVGSNLVYGFAP